MINNFSGDFRNIYEHDSFTVAGTVVQVNYLMAWCEEEEEVESMHDDGVSASRAK